LVLLLLWLLWLLLTVASEAVLVAVITVVERPSNPYVFRRRPVLWRWRRGSAAMEWSSYEGVHVKAFFDFNWTPSHHSDSCCHWYLLGLMLVLVLVLVLVLLVLVYCWWVSKSMVLPQVWRGSLSIMIVTCFQALGAGARRRG